MKKELKDQFLPTNTAWMARESLKKLKQTGSVRDYVKEFRSLILDIKDMSEVNKLFNFMSGLQGWAQTELEARCPRLPLSHGSSELPIRLQGDLFPYSNPKGERPKARVEPEVGIKDL